MKHKGQKTALEYVISGLIPYTKENMLLSFKPNKFFYELEKISRYKERTLRSAMARAQENGYIIREKELIKITEEGLRKIQPFRPKRLKKNVLLMIIFDIPEDRKIARQRLRRLLRRWKFTQTQKSVWTSHYDYKDPLRKFIKTLDVEKFVELFEAAIL